MARFPGLFVTTLVSLAVSYGTAALALSDTYETAPEQDAVVVLEGKDAGPGYLVLSPVRGDGFLRLYNVQTDAGIEHVSGDGLLKVRLHELKVLAGLRKLETEQSFLDGLARAAQRPVGFVESTVADPLGTAKDTLSGVGRMFSRIGEGVEQAVTGEASSAADLAKIITGQARARRELAVKLGVDPYTQYYALSEALDKAASVSVVGSLSVEAILALVPGGVVPQSPESDETFRTSLIDRTQTELEDHTIQGLQKAGIPEDVIDRLIANRNFTPKERWVLAFQLKQFSLVDGLDLLIARAAEARTRDQAYFQLRRLVLTRHYHQTIAGLSSIKMVAGFPIAIRGDGAAAVILPLDMVAWTGALASSFSNLNEGIVMLAFPPSGVDFVMTGDITDMAAERITALGWRITSNLPMPDGPVR